MESMQLIRHLPEKSDRASAVAIGNFDGLHRGHQAVIAAMTLAATAEKLVPSVLTFEPHPRRFFAAHMPAFRLEKLAVKLRRLRAAGVERLAMPHFNAAFAGMEAQVFLDEVLGRQLGARVVVTGENFAFGKNRGGDSSLLRAWGATHGVNIITVPSLLADGVACSSSGVRQAIGAGDMALAKLLLGRFYALEGRVQHGDGRGAQLGFATANIALPAFLKLPAHGVYAVRATIRGVAYDAVANLGVRPTVGGQTHPSLEVHLFDYAGVLYGERMEVAFVQKLRDEKRFDSLGALTAQIAGDCAAAKIALANAG
jgi:riboflavin kinase/FMN adenylyltransferase